MKKLLLSALLLTSCDQSEVKKTSSSPPAVSDDQLIERMVLAETMVRNLTPQLRHLAGDLSQAPAPLPDQWLPFLKPDHVWLNASFGTLAGYYEVGQFITKTKFEGLVKDSSGKLTGIKAKQKLTWETINGKEPTLISWEQLAFETETSARPLFEDVTTSAIPSRFAREDAQRSAHAEITELALSTKRLILPKREYADIPDMESTSQYPSVSVVDYDSDGHEDFLITARYTDSQLFKNLGNGTFEDRSLEAGFTPGHCVSFTLFADFDNDGDPDALICRTLEPTLYYQNEKGRFKNVTSKLSDLGEQYFVVSAAATDINRDGLLDVYLTTYSPGNDVHPTWKERYLPRGEAAAYEKISKNAHPYFDDRGIANVLLMNRGGGHLERAGGEPVKLWRKSYQPIWADFDGDGDDDLYVCNDFSPDSFLRNDTPKGAAEPIFTEIFKEVFPEGEMAFGMGASLGDYDNDGDLDLFVSNMYSKAGNRIINHIGDVDPRIKIAARGNFLYQNEGGIFKQMAQADANETRTGWAFGGQFADFNNDGLLDLYVPSGLYSAPKAVATEVDL